MSSFLWMKRHRRCTSLRPYRRFNIHVNFTWQSLLSLFLSWLKGNGNKMQMFLFRRLFTVAPRAGEIELKLWRSVMRFQCLLLSFRCEQHTKEDPCSANFAAASLPPAWWNTSPLNAMSVYNNKKKNSKHDQLELMIKGWGSEVCWHQTWELSGSFFLSLLAAKAFRRALLFFSLLYFFSASFCLWQEVCSWNVKRVSSWA